MVKRIWEISIDENFVIVVVEYVNKWIMNCFCKIDMHFANLCMILMHSRNHYSNGHANHVLNIYIYTHIHVYIYIYIYAPYRESNMCVPLMCVACHLPLPNTNFVKGNYYTHKMISTHLKMPFVKSNWNIGVFLSDLVSFRSLYSVSQTYRKISNIRRTKSKT